MKGIATDLPKGFTLRRHM